MNQDSELPLNSVRVDGGMTENELMLQLQADILGIKIGNMSNVACNLITCIYHIAGNFSKVFNYLQISEYFKNHQI